MRWLILLAALACSLYAQAVTIKIATVNNEDLQFAEQLSNEFQRQNPDITLDWFIVDESVLRLRQSRDSKKEQAEFDIYTLGFLEAANWGQLGRLQPVPDWILDSTSFQDFIPSILDGFRSSSGSLYGLPFYGESSMTYYRADRFAQYGLSMPLQPEWSQLTSALTQLRLQSGGQLGRICLRGKSGWGENVALFSTLMNAFGGRWFDLEWQATIDDARWREALAFYLNTQREFGMPNSWQNGYSENLAYFTAGECDVWVDSTAAAPSVNAALGDSVAYALAPISATEKGASWLWSWGFAVPEAATNATEAWRFIQWVTSSNYQSLVEARRGVDRVPPGTRLSLYQNPAYQQLAPFSGITLQSIQKSQTQDQTLLPTPYNGIQYVQTPEFEQLGQFIGKRLSSILEKYIKNEELDLDADIESMTRFANANRRVAQYLLDRGIDNF